MARERFYVLHAPSMLSATKDIPSLTFAVFKCVECFNTQLCCWSVCLEESMASRRNHLAEKSKYSVKTGTSFPYLIGNSKVMGCPFISKLEKKSWLKMEI